MSHHNLDSNDLMLDASVIEHLPGNLMIVDEHGLILLCNRGTARHFNHHISPGSSTLNDILPGIGNRPLSLPTNVTIESRSIKISKTPLADSSNLLITFEYPDEAGTVSAEDLAHGSTDEMWVLDNELRLISFNQAFKKSIEQQITTPVHIGDPVLIEGFSNDQLNFWKSLYDKALAGEPIVHEVTITDQEQAGYAQIKITPVVKAGNVVGLTCASRNITDIKNKQLALEDKSQRLQKAFDIAQMGEWSFNIGTQTITWPGNSRKILGVDAEVLPRTTKDLEKYLSSSDCKSCLEQLQRAQESGTFNSEVKLLLPNSLSKWIKLAGQTEYSSKEEPTIISGVVQNIDAKKLIELQLIESEKRYRELVNACPALIYQYNVTQKQGIYYSGQVSDILGYSLVEIFANKDFLNKAIHPEDFKKLSKTYSNLKPNEKFIAEYRLRHKKGHWVWLKDFSIHIKKVDNNTILTGIAFDQTREKEYESRLDLALKSSELGVFEYHPITDGLILSDTTAEVLGNQKLPENFSELISLGFDFGEKKALRAHKHLMTDNASNNIKTGTFKLKNKHGAPFWIEAYSMAAEFNNKNEATRVIGTIKNITEKKQQEIALESTNQSLEKIIASVPGVVFRGPFENQEIFDFVSDQIEDLTGYTRKELQPWGDLSYLDLISDSERDLLSKIVADKAKTLTDYEITYKIKHKNGHEVWVWEKAGFVTIEDQIYLEGILADITDKIKAEDRIISATLQAEDAERQRISSEIHDGVQQTLIASLFTFQQLQERLDGSFDESLQDLYANALKLLQTGVAETKMIAHSIMPKSIQDFGLIETLEHLSEALSKSTSIDFKFFHNLTQDNIKIEIATSIYRICQEATNNVVKYAKAKEAIIQLMEYEDKLIVSIEDDGIGFDPNETDMLYSGLGFSFMRSRVNAISGTVDFSSRPGRGTQIVVEIPSEKLRN